ncbi:hypothetical protein QT21_00095, partial [Staphylococcus aureus]
NQPQQARLARTVRADQAAAGACRQFKADVLQGFEGAVAVADATRLQRQGRHCRLAGQSTGALRT